MVFVATQRCGLSSRRLLPRQAVAFFFVALLMYLLPIAQAAAQPPVLLPLAHSKGEFPAVTASAAIDPYELVFRDQFGRELRRQPIKDRTGRLNARVCAILVAPERHSFVVVFSGMPELWEVSYNPSAPEIGLGMVHDFQYREGQFAPGYLHPQRTSLPFLVSQVALGQDGHTVVLQPRAGSGQSAGLQLVHLDVRKTIREAASPALPWSECSP